MFVILLAGLFGAITAGMINRSIIFITFHCLVHTAPLLDFTLYQNEIARFTLLYVKLVFLTCHLEFINYD